MDPSSAPYQAKDNTQRKTGQRETCYLCLHQAHLNGSRFGMTFQEMLGFDLTLSVPLCWVLWGHWFGTSLSF